MTFLYALIITLSVLSFVSLFVVSINKVRYRIIYGITYDKVGVQKYSWFCSKNKLRYLDKNLKWGEYEHLIFESEEEAITALKDLLSREQEQKKRHVRKYRRIKI